MIFPGVMSRGGGRRCAARIAWLLVLYSLGFPLKGACGFSHYAFVQDSSRLEN